MDDLRTRMLDAIDGDSGSGKSSQNGSGRRPGSGRKKPLSEEDIVKRLKKKSRPANEQSPALRRKFLHRLTVALHSYGSSASRTEFLIERAAARIEMDVTVAVFPSVLLLSFPGCEEKDAINVIACENGLDVDKLGRVDELANKVGTDDAPLLLAYWRLKAIASSPSKFSVWWWRLIAFTLSASVSAMLFFDGTLWDGLMASGLGLVVGICVLIGEKSPLFASVQDFMTTMVVSFLARLMSVYCSPLNVCYYSMVLAPLVQILPGMQLTLGVSEMVSKAYVTGTSRIMFALFGALQLGFGLAVGENLVFWIKDAIPTQCDTGTPSLWWRPLWFVIYSVASNVLLNARLDQWPGMIVTSGFGYLVSTWTGQRLSGSASSVLAAFVVGTVGTLYSNVGQGSDLPLVRLLAGIRLLVPGGMGVQGVAALLEGDDDEDVSGMGFVFDMLVVGLSICIGLLIAKLCFPSGVFGNVSSSTADARSKLSSMLKDGKDGKDSDPSSDEEDPTSDDDASNREEHMPI